jgi:hypothetical protein
MSMYRIFLVVIVLFMAACNGSGKKPVSAEPIVPDKQQPVFASLIAVTDNTISESIQKDSLAFLILPIQASCPACRIKTIDSIVKYRDNLADRHFIIISGNAGRKSINGFFREQGGELPVIENQLFLDSTRQALKLDLYEDKPTVYYTYNKKAYKKVSSVPATVREDLHEFFSGHGD